MSLKYIYSAGSMSFGNGYMWHKLFNFPKLPIVTKTVTLQPKLGYPFAIIRIGNSIVNHVAHHNHGFEYYLKYLHKDTNIISIAGTDSEIEYMVSRLENVDLRGIQLSFSCPNVKDLKNKVIPKSRHKLYLKLNHTQDPYNYHLDTISGIMLNSIPSILGGISGKYAQKYNFQYIKKFNSEGLNIFGCSFVNNNDIQYLVEYCGCRTLAIGSVMLINPRLVENLNVLTRSI